MYSGGADRRRTGRRFLKSRACSNCDSVSKLGKGYMDQKEVYRLAISDEECFNELYSRFYNGPRLIPRQTILSMVFDTVLILSFVVASIVMSPRVAPNMEGKYKEYYLALYNRDALKKVGLKSEILNTFPIHKIHYNKSNGLGNYSWITMISGNDGVGLTGVIIAMKEALAQPFTTVLSISVLSLIFASYVIVTLDTGGHNFLTWLFRFVKVPNKSWFRYTMGEYIRNVVCNGKDVGLPTYIKAPFAAFPGFVVGFSVSLYLNELNLFISKPIVSFYVIGLAYFLVSCTGAVLIMFAAKLIQFLLLRFNIDISRRRFDDVLIVAISMLISVYFFENSTGSTISTMSISLLLNWALD